MEQTHRLSDLQSAIPLVEPSMLASDFANVEREIRRLEEAGARSLHLDIMDGHFVPNLSFGVPVVQAIRRVTSLVLETHLMISQPERYIEAFRDAGSDVLIIHDEAEGDTAALLDRIHELGAGAGLSLNPRTAVETLAPYLDRCDVVLVMSVEPGFGGQEFQPQALDKLRWLRAHARADVLLSVDGGVNDETISDCSRAGADLFVVGSGLLGHHDYVQRFRELMTLATTEKGVEA